MCKEMYSKSWNNAYYNYKETTSSYNEITEINLPHNMPNIGIIFEIVVWSFETACDVYKCDSFPINKLIKNFQ